MPVTVKVNGTENTVVHKGSMGMAKCTAPDVCKTPSPGGPVPMPYPVIVSMSSDLADGTTTVTADGGNSCAIKGSNFSRCTGDEPGTAGGVKSSTNMKEATWILYSMDVKMDGANACRKTDKMMMNHENTVCMTGEDQMTKKAKALKDLACDCDKKVDEETKKARAKGEVDCKDLGNLKHECCDEALKKGKVDGVKGEKGYDPETGNPTWGRAQRANEPYWRFLRRIDNKVFPDAQSVDANGNPDKFFDFKFRCPDPPRKGPEKKRVGWNPAKKKGKLSQLQKIKKLMRNLRPKVKRNPSLVSNIGCK
jgi:hypothetical protein